jgi:hypothetical protein
MAPLPPPLTNFVPTVTWEMFEQHQILESLRSQAEPQARDLEELSANRRQAAEIKAHILRYQHFHPQQIQPSQLVELGYAWCRVKLLLWRTFPINDLPVEIVANIFRYAVWSTKNSPEGILLRFRLTWVCQRWRHIAIGDPTLWNTIWFKDAKIGYQRSVMYFERAGSATLDLRIEDDEKTRSIPNQPMTGNDMERILDIIMTKPNQIRILIVVVEAWPPILVLLDRLHRSSRSLPQFERIEIHRTGRPYRWDGPGYSLHDYQHALTLCDGRTQRLNFLCLNGVHIDWDKSHLANLVNLDLRRMPPDLGPSLKRFRYILENSPNLKKLSLDGAGPVMPLGPASRPIPPVSLPQLESLVLGDVPISYGVFCAKILHCPNVRELTILNMVGEDHAPLLLALTGKLPELLILSLYGVNIKKCTANGRIVTQWLLSIPKLRFMRVAAMKPQMLAHFFVDGRLHIRDEIPLVPTPQEEEAILAEGSRINVCPELEAIEVQHIDMESVIYFVFGRRRYGVPLRKLYIHHNWLQSMKPEEKAMLAKQKYGPNFVSVTVPMSLTPVEEAIWMHVRTTRSR